MGGAAYRIESRLAKTVEGWTNDGLETGPEVQVGSLPHIGAAPMQIETIKRGRPVSDEYNW
jgi:hypothetical protein